MPDYPYSELTKQIIGCLFSAFKDLGYGYQEKYYQRAFAVELREANLSFEKEKKKTIQTHNVIIGRYFVDFLIDKKVAVEMKVAENFYPNQINQLLAYMKSMKIKVGLLAIVTTKGVRIKRLIN